MKNIILEKKDGFAKITLNRPETLNALDLKTFEELREAIEEIRKDEEVRAVLITGSGRAFCSGVDLTFIDEVTKLTPKEFREKLRELQNVFNSLEELEKPVIAAINGFALGGGCDLALACDIRIAAKDARIGEQYVKVGLIPDLGGTQRLPRIVGVGKAKELIFTGKMIDAEEAEKIGLVNEVVPPDELESHAEELAKTLAKGPSIAIGLAKIAINKGLGTDLRSGLEYEVYGQSICLQTEDQKEGVSAFLEKREPVFKGK
ncbi:MAG: enoyl-CoA hydratase/isomerase family protein [Candidatus Syntropharchaeia archaeon]